VSRRVFVLDACAMIAAQQGEAGGEQLITLLAEPDARGLMHAINLCEVYYDLLRRDPQAQLESLLDELAQWGVTVEHDMSLPLLRRAGEIKALWRRISLADCFALALAEQRGAELLTTDHHELDPLSDAAYPIRFLR